jgi:hypothetical protein
MPFGFHAIWQMYKWWPVIGWFVIWHALAIWHAPFGMQTAQMAWFGMLSQMA